MLQWVPCTRNTKIRIAWVSQAQLIICLLNYKCIFHCGGVKNSIPSSVQLFDYWRTNSAPQKPIIKVRAKERNKRNASKRQNKAISMFQTIIKFPFGAITPNFVQWEKIHNNYNLIRFVILITKKYRYEILRETVWFEILKASKRKGQNCKPE
jgi:hypothetical protein